LVRTGISSTTFTSTVLSSMLSSKDAPGSIFLDESLVKRFYTLADTKCLLLHRVKCASVEVYSIDTRQATSHTPRSYKKCNVVDVIGHTEARVYSH
jgi:hypothetical protein